MEVRVSNDYEQKQGRRSAGESCKSKSVGKPEDLSSAGSEVAKGGRSRYLMKVWTLSENGEVLQLSWMTA